jgi:multicomponent Na+:H+ antiporter subunit E
MYRLLIFSLLLVAWLIFSGFFDPFHISLGIISCLAVTWMSADLLFENRSAGLELRVRELLRIPAYLGWLLWQIVLANVSILKLVFQPGPLEGVAPQVVRFKTTLKSDWAKFVLAQSITLTPGTVTIKIVGDEFFVHAISQEAADGLDGAMEGWIKHVYEPEQQEGAVT